MKKPKKKEKETDSNANRLRSVSFRADERTLESLEKLVAVNTDAVKNRRSSAIRNAINEAAERLEER